MSVWQFKAAACPYLFLNDIPNINVFKYTLSHTIHVLSACSMGSLCTSMFSVIVLRWIFKFDFRLLNYHGSPAFEINLNSKSSLLHKKLKINYIFLKNYKYKESRCLGLHFMFFLVGTPRFVFYVPYLGILETS